MKHNQAKMPDETIYISTCKCGGIIYAAVLNDITRNDVAKDIARLIRKGFVIEKANNADEVRQGKWCKNRGKCKAGEQ